MQAWKTTFITGTAGYVLNTKCTFNGCSLLYVTRIHYESALKDLSLFSLFTLVFVSRIVLYSLGIKYCIQMHKHQKEGKISARFKSQLDFIFAFHAQKLRRSTLLENRLDFSVTKVQLLQE